MAKDSKVKIIGLEDYWAVTLDGEIINSFNEEEEAIKYADSLE